MARERQKGQAHYAVNLCYCSQGYKKTRPTVLLLLGEQIGKHYAGQDKAVALGVENTRISFDCDEPQHEQLLTSGEQ